MTEFQDGALITMEVKYMQSERLYIRLLFTDPVTALVLYHEAENFISTRMCKLEF